MAPRVFPPHRLTLPFIAAGIALAIGMAALWHGPLGAGDRFARTVESQVRTMLDHYEMNHIAAPLHRGPLSRTVNLSGPTSNFPNDFQRSEMVIKSERLPGVSEARWDGTRGSAFPLLLEAIALALVGFAAGLLIPYLIRLRRLARRFDRF